MKTVALIFGGPSAEHDVSLVSAKNIYQVLKETNYTVCLLGITRKKVWKKIDGNDLLKTSFQTPLDLDSIGTVIQLRRENNCVYAVDQNNLQQRTPLAVAFPIIHGPYGEDGQLQMELNEIGLSFVGSDSEGCKNSFDKGLTKQILQKRSVPQAPFLIFENSKPSFTEVENQLGLPFFVKPANMGSSIGISKVKNREQFQMAIDEAFRHDTKIVIEGAIVGREIECALLQAESLKVTGVGEVVPKHEFYSYEAKYLDPNGADLIIPAQVEPKIVTKIQEMAKVCFEALGCRDYSRADFFLTKDNQIYFNEINTHPGFTNISQFPMLWKQEGVSYQSLILHLIELALKR